jgi:sugar transferase (PEP-CTERM system associated)
MRIFNRYFSSYDLFLPIGDIAISLLAILVAHSLGEETTGVERLSASPWMTVTFVVTSCVVVAFYYSGLYEIDQALSQRELMVRFANGFGVACLFVAATSYPVQQSGLQRIVLIEILLMGIGLFGWRLAFGKILRERRVHGTIAIIGTQKIGMLVAEELCRRKHLGLRVAYFVGPEAGEVTLTYGNPRRVTIPMAPPETTLQLVEQCGVNSILIAGPERGQRFPANDLLLLRLKGVPIEECHTFYERLMSKISIVSLRPSWLVLSQGFRRTELMMMCKRIIDIVVSIVGMLLSLPIALITAIAIKLDSPGPILYSQERIGQNEVPFTLYKFRSMTADAESMSGPQWAGKDDPRVTRVGRILRKLRIDELPQIINVLKGDMSFVGPRPEREFFVSKLKDTIPYYSLRFTIKPGITGWAQISYPYGDSEEDAVEKLQYDLYYTKYMSPVFDLQILFETVKVVLLGKGAQ